MIPRVRLPGSAELLVVSLGAAPQECEATAGFVTASCNAFDKAAREFLGVDATKLAAKVDLTKILREWAFFVTVHGSYGTQEDCGVTTKLLEEKFGKLT